jgi:hypothetical protein
MEYINSINTELSNRGITDTSITDVLINDFKITDFKDGILTGDNVSITLQDLIDKGIIESGVTADQFKNGLQYFINPDNNNNNNNNTDGDAANNNAVGFKQGDSITVDNVDYVINATGDAVDTNGEIVLSAAEIAEQMGEASGDSGILDSIAKIDGLIAYDEQGDEITFEDSIEGLASRNAYIVKQESRNAVGKAFDAFFEENPELEDMFKYKLAVGSLKGYNRDVTLLTTPLTKDTDIHIMETVVRDIETKRGRNPQQIDRLIEMYKTNEILLDEATSAQMQLKAIKVKEDSALEERRVANEKLQSAKINEHWSRVNTIIKTGKFDSLGFNIPENFKIKTKEGAIKTASRDDFYKYISKAVTAEGYSQAQLDRASVENNLEYRIFSDLLFFLGGDMEQFIKQQVANKKVSDIINRKQQMAKPNSQAFTRNSHKSAADRIKV